MRLGFDGKRVIQNFTGLGNYSRFILNILTRNFPENSYLVYTSKTPDKDQRNKLDKLEFRHPKKKKFASLWRTFSIVKDLKRDNVSLYHGLSNEIPAGLAKAGIASVVTIHDLIFLRFPQYYRFIDRNIYKIKFRYACRNADYIIAISEQTKRDIISYFNVPEEKIRVIYQNCGEGFHEKLSAEAKEQIRSMYKLPKRYLLNVGTIEPRKNLMLIAKALKSVPDIHLVVVGKSTPYTIQVKNQLESDGLSHRVHFLTGVKTSDLPAIYQLADVFIYPSKFEGFGIPVVEALHSGIPVIAATGSCLEEAGGPSSYYIDPEDDKQLAEYINLILNNPDIATEMVKQGSDYVKRFDDKNIASDLIALYQKAINHYA
jgi:glycosyltransferase involved in cell wall biosynthesis